MRAAGYDLQPTLEGKVVLMLEKSFKDKYNRMIDC
jgi:hypothetical protein